MANCQVLSFDKVLNGQKVKPTHHTHTHTLQHMYMYTHTNCAPKLLEEKSDSEHISLTQLSFFCLQRQVNFIFSQVNLATASFNMENFWPTLAQVVGKKKSLPSISASSNAHAYMRMCVCASVGFFWFVYGKCYCLTLNFGTCLSAVR